MSSGPVRRAHLIAPFGVGALLTVPNGTALVAAGLDHWYEREDTDRDTRDIDLSEFRLEEWRLQRLLGVDHFREPPDYRVPQSGQPIPNVKLTVPFLRFPLWHFCWRCNRLTDLELVTRGRQLCLYCQREGKRAYLAQVPFVAICDQGHLQDFPWREWVHHTASPSCRHPMRLRSTGGATLANQVVECECGVAPRTLGGIVEADPNGSTFLSRNLEAGAPYLCRGISPQHGSTQAYGCDRHLRGSLRSASNLYFALVESAIYLPRTTETVPEELMAALEIPSLARLIDLAARAGQPATPVMLREAQRELLEPFLDSQLEEAVRAIAADEEPSEQGARLVANETAEEAFRREEYVVLRTGRRESQLSVTATDLADYDRRLGPYVERILLVDRLRETRVLTGFSRVYSENTMADDERLGQLWKHVPPRRERWLPAYKVFGEGIFIELNLHRVGEWEASDHARQSAQKVDQRYAAARRERHLRHRAITPRLLLLHTFSHLLMNQLTFECGYSSASLRERLYVSDMPDAPMVGVLVYTAAGDAEGTMGGLVRMGKPGYLEPAILAALSAATWCSADPVCMEAGALWGQGPDSCNLAACHNCALVPETACEMFNRFLDRAAVVGTVERRETGFFHGLL